jgi:pyruvate dehydrogenase E2 component (dihydrolipoamide acetyltransferase)
VSSQIEQINVPDIGGATGVDVIEVLVKPGDKIELEDSIITLEGDKATMDVPSSVAGIVKAITLKVGDKVSEGDAILSIECTQATAPIVEEPSSKQAKPAPAPTAKDTPAAPASGSSSEILAEVCVPDIGGATDVDVIEVSVSAGDVIEKDAGIITLEGDKATMDIPSPYAGEVVEVKVKEGDKVSQGSIVLLMKSTDGAAAVNQTPSVEASQPEKVAEVAASPVTQQAPPQEATIAAVSASGVHAGPAVRRVAHELGLDLTQITATGSKGRITKDDVKRYVQTRMQSSGAGGGAGFALPSAPTVDFSRFGDIESKALSKIQKISGANLHRNWVSIPHITQFAEADTTEMEAFRQAQKDAAAKQGIRLTPLVFLMKAVVAALKEFPHFNASLDASGESLVMKKYYHVGVAVDTPKGLVVPVIRDIDKKGLYELAKELGAISVKAREKGLSMAEMQGGCFTISSLGGIGGTAFTPIINAPEVAILGVSKSEMKPVYNKSTKQFDARLMLPLSLSYDHRVIDGADGARFMMYLSKCLTDIRTLLL